MSLSTDLISQFVKTTKDTDNTKKESTLRGTVKKVDTDETTGKITADVELDGSTVSTPMTSTVEVGVDDRVVVMIKDHKATVTGNLSEPVIKVKTVQEIAGTLKAENAEIKNLVAEKATIEQLEAEQARIGELVAENAEIKELVAEKATIEQLQAESAKITALEAKDVEISGTLTANSAKITDLEAETAEINTLVSKKASIEQLEAEQARIDDLEAETAEINTLVSKKASIEQLEAEQARIGALEAKDAEISGTLTANSAKIGTLETGVADINTLMFGSATGDTIQTDFANAVIAQLGDAQIKSAMIEDVSASKITSGEINTNNVHVVSEDGKLTISDETIQISDGTRVRVQIGKDAANDYSINIWDQNGKLMFSEGGITDEAIKTAIIRNDMVSETANIHAGKLDIGSLFTKINEDGSNTIKSTKVFLDEENQTLDVAFKEMTTNVTEQGETISSQGTAISTIQRQISSRIWQEDINTATGEMSTKYSELEQSLDGFKTTVSDTYATKKDVDSDIDNLNDRVSTAETSITQQTEAISLCATKTEVNTAKEDAISAASSDATTKANDALNSANANTTNLLKSYSTTAEMNAAIDLKADSITSTVSAKYAEKTEVDTAKSEAISAASSDATTKANKALEDANANTADLLKSYSTTAEMNSAITQSAGSITSSVKATFTTGPSNLVLNGYGEWLDNTNFTGGTFTKGDCPDDCYGYFTNGTTRSILFDTTKVYDYKYYCRAHGGTAGSNYFSIIPLDIDGNEIGNQNVLNYNSNLFYLKEDLKNGDTVVYFNDLTEWLTNTTQTYQRSFLIFGYTDRTGNTYPDGTYSRNFHGAIYSDNSSVNKTNNTITLSSAWTGGTVNAGTCIAQASLGNNHCYYGQTGSISNVDWKKWTGTIYAGNIGGNVSLDSRRLLYAHSFKVNLWNNQADYAGIDIREHTIDKEARESLTEAQGTINGINSRVETAESQIIQLSNSVVTLVKDENGKSVLTQDGNKWSFELDSMQDKVNGISETTEGLKDNLDGIGGSISSLNNAVDSISEKTAYVTITQDDDGNACIDLGSEKSPTKLRITNEKMSFTDGANDLAWFSSDSLDVKNIEVDQEIRQGGFVWTVRANGNYGLVWKGTGGES